MTGPRTRPDPDALLARVQAEEQQQQRGRLKIFLGYAAGVGKTFAMLEAAQQRKIEGVDVVVGYIETHRRAETEAKLAEQARRAQVLEATDKLQTALLNSISHDLRTPLVSITGALSTLEDEDTALDAGTRRALIENAREEAERLNRLVGNLLDMTRLEAGAMKVRREPADVQDLVGSALAQLGARLEGHPVSVQMPEGLPLVQLDFVLMVQLLYNLLDNALKYSPAGAPIEVSARAAGSQLELAVGDRGAGIPAADLAYVFDLRVNISNLRRKIEPDPARPRYILTEPGVGYRLQTEN